MIDFAAAGAAAIGIITNPWTLAAMVAGGAIFGGFLDPNKDVYVIALTTTDRITFEGYVKQADDEVSAWDWLEYIQFWEWGSDRFKVDILKDKKLVLTRYVVSRQEQKQDEKGCLITYTQDYYPYFNGKKYTYLHAYIMDVYNPYLGMHLQGVDMQRLSKFLEKLPEKDPNLLFTGMLITQDVGADQIFELLDNNGLVEWKPIGKPYNIDTTCPETGGDKTKDKDKGEDKDKSKDKDKGGEEDSTTPKLPVYNQAGLENLRRTYSYADLLYWQWKQQTQQQTQQKKPAKTAAEEKQPNWLVIAGLGLAALAILNWK